jgi:hypothetical protein
MITILMMCAMQTNLQEIESRLSTRIPEVDFDATPLEDAIGVIRTMTQLNIILDPATRQDHATDTVTLKLKNLSVKTVLKIMLGDKKLTLVYREGVVVVAPQEQVNQKVVTRVYDVRDMVYKTKSFPGPKVELIPPNSTGSGQLAGAIFEIDNEGGGVITEDFLTGLIPQSTGDGKWDETEGAGVSMINNMMVVTQSEKVQREVADLLRLLRQFK